MENKMLDSDLNLIGRDLQDVQREFNVFLIYLKSIEYKEMTAQEAEHFNKDINGWLNWFESLKIDTDPHNYRI